jgi:uncharacterized protein YijF (DUF1287 family)
MRPSRAVLLVAVFALAAASAEAGGSAARVVERAREEVARGVTYDASYQRLAYPGGDVDPGRGACADVVVRAMRAAGIDLQQLVHEDELARPFAYPFVTTPDASIDHRRITSLKVWLDAHAVKLTTGYASDAERATWRAGDVVVWKFCETCRPRHTGIVSDLVGASGLHLVIHNLAVAREEDVLDAWPVVGHYRVVR